MLVLQEQGVSKVLGNVYFNHCISSNNTFHINNKQESIIFSMFIRTVCRELMENLKGEHRLSFHKKLKVCFRKT